MRNGTSSASFNPKVYSVVACCVAAILLLGSILPLPSLPGQFPVQAASPLRTIPNTDINPYGANFFLDWEVEPWKVDKTLEMAKQAGIGWANIHFVWEGLEPKNGSYWDDRFNTPTWNKYDLIVSTAEKYGIKIIARLDRPPAWTRKDNTVPERPPDDFDDYGDFIEAVVTRYAGRVRHYQIWNEPNIFPEWGNQPVDPVAYVRLLKTAYQRAKKVDPNVYILTAPLAQTIETGPRNLNELDFLARMYRAGAKDYFDILYANGYGFDSPPDDPADPKKLNFARVSLLREVMEENGDPDTPVWLHEFGWNASPETMLPEKLVWRRVSEQQQADYTVQAIRTARAEWPWVGVFSIWYFRQDGHITPDRSDYYFRMVDPGFTPRKIYYAVSNETKGLTVASPGSYQETNPALTSDAGWDERLERAASGGAWLVSEQPGASATVKFFGTDFNIVTVNGPDGGRLLVTVDGRAANALPASGEGRSYVDLFSAKQQLGVVVPVASNLPNAEHVVRLTVATDRNPGSAGQKAVLDGFQVAGASQRDWLSYLTVGAAAFLALTAIAFIWRRRARPTRPA